LNISTSWKATILKYISLPGFRARGFEEIGYNLIYKGSFLRMSENPLNNGFIHFILQIPEKLSLRKSFFEKNSYYFRPMNRMLLK